MRLFIFHLIIISDLVTDNTQKNQNSQNTHLKIILRCDFIVDNVKALHMHYAINT